MVKILLVDDDAIALRMLEDYIQEALAEIKSPLPPIQIIQARCEGETDAIEAISKEQPDILFLDYTLMQGTGAEVAKWVDSEYHKPVKVATHTLRFIDDARALFSGTSCVTHFLGISERRKKIEIFLRECLIG